MSEWQVDSLLRADFMEQFDRFKGYGKDALLLTLLSYNVSVCRVFAYGKQFKSQLFRKIEQGIGISRRNTYPLGTIKARYFVGYFRGGVILTLLILVSC